MKKIMKAGKIVKQAAQLQLALSKIRKEAASREYEAIAGPVKACVTGDQKLVSLDVKSGADLNELLPAVVEAVNRALWEAEKDVKRQMAEVTKDSPARALVAEV